MAIRIAIDSSALEALQGRSRLLTDQNLRFAAARALNGAGGAAKSALRVAMPRFIDKPVPYTLNSAFQRFAKASDLSTTIGVADQARRGHPAARYLLPIIEGTTPTIKGVDLSGSKLARTDRRAVLRPARNSPLRMTAAGNYTVSAYAKVLQSARQGGDKYFIAPVQHGSTTMAVFARAGRGGKDTRRVFTLDPNPKRRRQQFPLQQVVTDAFAQAWPSEARAAVEAELARVLGPAR